MYNLIMIYEPQSVSKSLLEVKNEQLPLLTPKFLSHCRNSISNKPTCALSQF